MPRAFGTRPCDPGARPRAARSGDAAGFLEAQARAAAEQLARIALAQVHQEVRLDRRAGEEGFVELLRVEAAHAADVQPERTRRHDEVAALDARIAEGGRVDHRLVADEP